MGKLLAAGQAVFSEFKNLCPTRKGWRQVGVPWA